MTHRDTPLGTPQDEALPTLVSTGIQRKDNLVFIGDPPLFWSDAGEHRVPLGRRQRGVAAVPPHVKPVTYYCFSSETFMDMAPAFGAAVVIMTETVSPAFTATLLTGSEHVIA